MQTNGIKLIFDLYEHLDSDKPISDASARSIVAAIRHSMISGDTLDISLGLHRSGRSNCLSSRIAKARRNGFINDAIHAVREGDMSEWNCCKNLSIKIKAFLSGNEWRSTRYLSAPPLIWPAWKRYLWLAKSTDIDLPKSARQLRSIMLETAVFNPHEEPEKLLALKLYPTMQNDHPGTERKH